MLAVPIPRIDDSRFRVTLPAAEGDTVLLVTCDACAYPLDRHCRYARHRDAALPYTFGNMDFHDAPPGLRSGPWPGWRGIPRMPGLTLVRGDTEQAGAFDFWGDEGLTGRLRCRFLLSPHAGGECTLTAEDARIVPLEGALYPVHVPRIEPRELALRPELAGRHPRLLFTAGEIPAMRRRAEGTHAAHVARITELLRLDDGRFAVTTQSKLPDGPERLAPEDRIVLNALMALLADDAACRGEAIAALLAYAERTREADFEPLRIDTQSGEVLFTLCLGIDMLHDALPVRDRERLCARADEIAELCWSYLDTGRTDYAQAHYLGCGMGVLAHALTFWERHAAARVRAAFLRGVLEHVLALLPEDGFFPHGINLWVYEHGFLLRWMEMLRCAAGIDCWRATPYFSAASRFRGASTAPDARYALTFGDPQFLVTGDAWCHALIAARCDDARAGARAGAIADALRDLPVAGVDFRHAPARRRAWEFLFDAPASSAETRALEQFADGGQVFVRSRDMLFTCRCGPPLGRSRLRGGMQGGYGHADPCNGSFLLWVGKGMLAAGPGPVYRRDTALQNLFTVNGKGQIGDGCVWLPDFIPPEHMPDIPRVEERDGVVRISMDLTRAYLPALGVRSCTRELALHPGRIEGVDVIRCTGPSLLAWNLHTRCAVVPSSGNAFRLIGDSLVAELHFTCDSEFETSSDPSEFVPAYPNDGVRDNHIQLRCHADALRIAWVLSWS